MTNSQPHIRHSLNAINHLCAHIRSNPLPRQVLRPDPTLSPLPPTPLKNVSLRFITFHFFNLSHVFRKEKGVRLNAVKIRSCGASQARSRAFAP